jgi:hypothetical protein
MTRYSVKEMNWLLKKYEKGLSWADIAKRHMKKKRFPVRSKAALAKCVSLWLRK